MIRFVRGSFFVILLCGVCGCEAIKEKQAADRKAKEEKMEALESLFGKKIITVSGVDKPIVIHVEGGGRFEIDCHPYELETTIKPAEL